MQPSRKTISGMTFSKTIHVNSADKSNSIDTLWISTAAVQTLLSNWMELPISQKKASSATNPAMHISKALDFVFCTLQTAK